MVVFLALQLPPFLSPAHVAIKSGRCFPSAVSELPASSWLYLWLSAVLRGPRGSVWLKSYGAQEQGFQFTWPTCQSPPGTSCKEKNNKISGSICWLHFYTLHSNPKFSSWGVLRIIQRKRGETIIELAREEGLLGACSMPEEFGVLLRRGCSCVLGHCNDGGDWAGVLMSPKSPLILPNQG